MDFLLDITLDALIDTVKILPFLFVCYLAMEALEHAAGGKSEQAVKKAGKFGPLIGSLLGALPQCGFSAAAATLYSGRVITLGTLIAVFLATSDEMLPILIAEQADITKILWILGSKVAIGMVTGFAIDLFLRFTHKVGAIHFHIEEMCEENDCDCEDGVLRSAIRHTLQVTFFIFVITLLINGVIELGGGEDALAAFLATNPYLSIVLSATVGLVPNCAASVIITELFLEGTLSTAAMMSGLLVSAGIGLLVLVRASRPTSRNIIIIVALWGVGIFWGVLFQLLGIAF